jgi:hypothetical protein
VLGTSMLIDLNKNERVYANLINGFHHCDYFLRVRTKIGSLGDALPYISEAAKKVVEYLHFSYA